MNMTLTSLVVVSALVQYMRVKRGHGTVWRPVNNPISRRTDETKSVTSELVTQRSCSSPQSALSRGASAMRGTEVFWSHCISLWHGRHYAHNVASASSQLLVTESLSKSLLSNSIQFLSGRPGRESIRLIVLDSLNPDPPFTPLTNDSQNWHYTYRCVTGATWGMGNRFSSSDH